MEFSCKTELHQICDTCHILKPFHEYGAIRGGIPPVGSGYCPTTQCEQCRKRLLAEASQARMIAMGLILTRQRPVRQPSIQWTREMAAKGRPCGCCGESHPEMLSIVRKAFTLGVPRERICSGAWKSVAKYLDSGEYWVLCMNCNLSEVKFGACSHKS